MASSSSRGLFSILVPMFILFSSFSEARDFLVPSLQSQSLSQWADASRFRIGDTLVWKNEDGEDYSVLQVSRGDYLSCNVSNPIAKYNDGNTKVKLDRSGPFYFTSGAKEQCETGQKLNVVVLSARHSRMFVGVSPAPSPMEFDDGPAVAPTSGSDHVFKSGAILMCVCLVGLGAILL